MKIRLKIVSLTLLLIAALFLMSTTKIIGLPEKLTGLIIPLYDDPDSSYWSVVMKAKSLHPRVPMAVIINPDSGPGWTKDQNYTELATRLKSTGIIVLGYVPTNFGNQSTNRVMNEILEYKNWYNVNGILFDEMPAASGKENYYKTIGSFAKSHGLLTVGNPGADVSESYVGILDNLIIYEDAGLPYLKSLQGWHLKYDKQHFSMTPYDVALLNQSYVLNATKYVGYIYITDAKLPNPWNTLPPYFNTLITMLDHLT